MNNIGALLMAGGKSSRMGEDKSLLHLGEKSFIDRISEELSQFDEKLLSVATMRIAMDKNWQTVIDDRPNCGPMGGIASALRRCKSDALLTIACDLPLYSKVVGDILCENLTDADAVVPIANGKIHPLCAVYHKRCLHVFDKYLSKGNYKLYSALKELNVHYIELGKMCDMLYNVNTRDDYLMLIKKAQ